MGFPPLSLGELFCCLRDLIIRKLIIIFILNSSPHSCIASLLNCSPFDPASSSPKQFLLSTSITFVLHWFPAGPPGNEIQRKEKWAKKEEGREAWQPRKVTESTRSPCMPLTSFFLPARPIADSRTLSTESPPMTDHLVALPVANRRPARMSSRTKGMAQPVALLGAHTPLPLQQQ